MPVFGTEYGIRRIFLLATTAPESSRTKPDGQGSHNLFIPQKHLQIRMGLILWV